LERLVIASRGSRLALIQADIVAQLIRSRDASVGIEVRTVKTTGDRDHRSFGTIGGKGLFVAEVEREVAEGRADIAVHSAKDLTSQLAPGCEIVCIPARAAVHDVVVGGRGLTGEERLLSLPPGATVGTSSMRRRALLAEMRSDVDVVDLRGNLDTRLEKVRSGEANAAVLAAAGIDRLGAYDGAGRATLDPARWVPAPGQGALAVEASTDRDDVKELLGPLTDPSAWAEVMLERSFARRLEGGCSVPLGCCATAGGSSLVGTGYLGHPDGSQSIRDRISGPLARADDLGGELADAVLRGGGDDLLAEVASWEAPRVESP
jgi:hydroxymethylbilane synthase